MLVGALAGYATALHGPDAAGVRGGGRRGRGDGGAVRLAGDRARHEPVRDGAGAEPVRRRLLRVRGRVAGRPAAARARARRDPAASRSAVARPRAVRLSPAGLPRDRRWRAALAWFFFRSRAGLLLRAVGESPESAHALGHRVRAIRLGAVAFGGALCGLAGAYVSLAYTHLWVENLIAGRGWIALALTTFATWRPARVLLGAYLFGGLTMLQFHLQERGVQIESHLLGMLPYAGDGGGAGADLAAGRLDPPQHARLAGADLPTGDLTITKQGGHH